MFKESKYIYIDNCFELGKFYAHYGHRNHSSIMQPVFKIVSNENLNKYELVAGYLDNNENFYNCPLVVHHLKIKYYSITHVSNNGKFSNEISITLFIEIYDLDYLFSKELEINICENKFTSIDFMRFNPIINYLNLFINSGRKINELNVNILANFYPESNSIENIIGLINNLEMLVFEDSQSRVGKDNRFWEDLEIRNLPENSYFIKLIKKCFENQGKRCKMMDYGLSVELCSDYAWSPSYSRNEIKNYDLTYIKDKLKVLIAAEFDTLEYILSGMEVNRINYIDFE